MVTLFLGLVCAGWFILCLRSMANALLLPALKPIAEAPKNWPSLTVVTTACNEEETVETALSSLAGQAYPKLEIVAVNDRSNDDTGPIIDRVAGRFPWVRPVHLKELPHGWLGKVHALHRASEAATTEWILFTDADIHFSGDCLQKAMAHAIECKVDHLVVLPNLKTKGWPESVTVAAMLLAGSGRFRTNRKGVLSRKQFMGAGAFNLVRRQALQQTPGFPHLKMEVIDDMGLGLLMQEGGFRTALVRGNDDLWVTWYPSFRAMMAGLEKNIYAALGGFRMAPALLRLLLFAIALATPWLGVFLMPPGTVPFYLALAALIIPVLAGTVVQARWKQPLTGALFYPLGWALTLFLCCRTVFLAHVRDGIVWRGTHYSLRSLQRGNRVRF